MVQSLSIDIFVSNMMKSMSYIYHKMWSVWKNVCLVYWALLLLIIIVYSYTVHIQISTMRFTISNTEHIYNSFISHTNTITRQPFRRKYRFIHTLLFVMSCTPWVGFESVFPELVDQSSWPLRHRTTTHLMELVF